MKKRSEDPKGKKKDGLRSSSINSSYFNLSKSQDTKALISIFTARVKITFNFGQLLELPCCMFCSDKA